MVDFLNVVVQVTSLLLIYHRISSIKLTMREIALVFLGTFFSSILLSTFFFAVVIMMLTAIGIKDGLHQKKYLAFFYSIYSVTFFSLVGNLSSLLGTFVDGKNIYIPIFFTALPVVINELICRLIHPDFDFLRSNYGYATRNLVIGVNFIFFSLCTVQYGSYYWEDTMGDIGYVRYYLTGSFLLLLIALVIYLNLKLSAIQQSQLRCLREEQIKHMEQYTSQIENLYTEVRSIRHDYINVMLSLSHGIEDENITEIKTVYNEVLSGLNASLQSSKYSLINLSKLKVPAIKSILSSKIIYAQQNGIEVNIEISSDVTTTYFDLLDYIRVIAIFLDNAIEASLSTDLPEMSVAFIEEDDSQTVIIVNNAPDSYIDKRRIFESGFSTKGDNRGIGLATVKDILNKYPNASLETEFKDSLFTQKLAIKKDV